ncbi:GntR family transcriptional regulator [Klebsiella pneumoniae]|uniref:GntR family transcriptional regulator n=1 Tax=Klebsiella pneumoniae TaxID=573 RepID=UPI00388F89AD
MMMIKSEQVYNVLYKEIINGNYNPGDKLPSENNLSVRFGVSRPTIARALMKLQEMDIIYSKKGSGHFISLTGVNKLRYAILAPRMAQDDSRYILDELFELLQKIATSSRITLLRGRMYFKSEHFKNIIETIKLSVDEYVKENVQGIFYVPIEFISESELINKVILEYIKKLNIQVILLDRDYVAPPLTGDFDVIMMNNISAGYCMTKHLLRSGAKKIAFLMLKDSAMTITSRLYGFNIAVLETLFYANSSTIIKTEKISTETIDTLRLNNVNHVVCANDFTAKCLTEQWQIHNLKIPLYTVSFDNASFSDDVSYSLTTWKHPLNEIAITAIALMNERVSNPLTPARVILLNGSIVKRKSCGL